MAEPADTPAQPNEQALDETAGVRCLKCGRPLRGVSHTGKCPGCGTRASKSLGSPKHKLDGHCLICAYDLRGLKHAEVCPECGTQVDLARLGTLLPRAGARSLGRARLGATLVCWAVLVMILVPIAVMLVATVVEMMSAFDSGGAGEFFAMLMTGGMLAAAVASAGLWATGSLLLARAGRDQHIAGGSRVPARLTAWAAWAFAGTAAVTGLLALLESVMPAMPWSEAAGLTLMLLMTLTALAGALAGLVLCGRVIGQTTNKAAKKRIKGLYWSLPLLGVGLLPAIAPSSTMATGAWGVLGCFSILLIVWPVYYASTLWLTRGELGRAMRIKANLAATPAAGADAAGTLA